ncbi:MAG: DUF1015 family protein [Lachnospiraceae bacterium]|nr:DUF1015 family protein [Lachnospiraceae bacterium]
MPQVTPFRAIRPVKEKAPLFCALPYDVYNRAEAKEIVKENPLSFLAIDRAETSFPDSVDTYADEVYEKAAALLSGRQTDGTLIQDPDPSYYIYELTMDGRVQTGITACSLIDDYLNGTIKKHENTREEKEIDRIRHVDTTNAHTGPIFLIYRANEELRGIVTEAKKEENLLYDFTSDDGIRHRAFRIADEAKVKRIREIFGEIPCTYIADGHHRCASAVKVGLKRRKENPSFTGEEGFNRFLSVLFPDDELKILPYNRVVRDLNGLTADEFMKKIREAGFEIREISGENVSGKNTENDTNDSASEPGVMEDDKGVNSSGNAVNSDAYAACSPSRKGTFSMYLEEKWYLLTASDRILSEDPVKGLDVSVLQDHLLGPVLGILDPRTDRRIDFVGGIRGNGELVRRCHKDMKAAFAMYPTSIKELLSVADAGLLMPPKSTWFEPKLRSGMFIHSLND